jgi:ATPase subunit of ABC transporter with duplicated ATPase domains
VDRRISGLAHQEQVARKERAYYEKQQEKFRQIQQKVEHAQNVISRQDPAGGRLLKKSMHRIKAYEARFEKEYESMTEIPETEDAIFIKFGEKAYMPAGKIVLEYELPQLMVEDRVLARNIFLRIKGPEKVCIIGRNGCGKTTLLRKIATELLKRKDIKASYMPQNYEELLNFDLTPVEFLSETGDKEETSRIRTYLGSMKYTPDEMLHKIGDLSGGQKAKLLLLKMSMSGSDVLILDEPTAGLDPKGREDILAQIKKLHDEYKMTIILVSHSMEDVGKLAKRIIVMNHGKVALQGEPKEIFKEIDRLEEMGLGAPQVTYLMRELKRRGFDVSDEIFTVEQCKKELLKVLFNDKKTSMGEK